MDKDARMKLREFQDARDLSLSEMGTEFGCSGGLVRMILEGEVTHPEIAKRIGEVAGLTELETEELMPENHRKHSPNYNPTQYVEDPQWRCENFGTREQKKEQAKTMYRNGHSSIEIAKSFGIPESAVRDLLVEA